MKKLILLLATGYSLLATAPLRAQIQPATHSTAAAASLVVSAAPGKLLHVSGYNAKASAQFIQIHDAASLPSDAVSAVAEISTCDLGTRTPAQLDGTYFTINSPTVAYYVWFNLDGAGVDPAVAGKTAIPVAITTGDTDDQMATAAAAAIDALAGFVSTATTTVITITNAVAAAATDINVGTSVTTVNVTQQGVTAIAATVPVFVITAAASSNFSFTLPAAGVRFDTGIVVCNSSTYATKTLGSADCFFSAVVAGY